MPRNIYLYHLDYEVQTLFGLDDFRQVSQQKVYKESENILKVAILLCDGELILPASNYFESDLGFNLLNSMDLSKHTDDVLFNMISSSYSLSELLEKKQVEHGNNIDRVGYHYADFINPVGEVYLPGILSKRKQSASVDIKRAWMDNEGREKLAKQIFVTFPKVYSAGKLEQAIGDVPEKLGERAYIGRYITPFFDPMISNRKSFENLINCFITKEYIRSFLDEFNAAFITDIPLFRAECILPQDDKYEKISYVEYRRKLNEQTYNGISAWKYVLSCNIEKLLEFKRSDCWRRVINPTDARIQIEGIREESNMSKQVIGEQKRDVFIVHGHDDAAKYELARTLEKCGFNAIILHEMANKGKTIIEKIEEFSDACYAVILYTEDDLGRDKNVKNGEKYRARQNVVFEHGYFMGKLGRDKVSALVKGNVETPGDIAGIIYIDMDSRGAWKNQLAKDMKAAGIDVDLNKFMS